MPLARKYRKPYRIKRKKSIFLNRFFGLGILFLIILGLIFYFFIFHSTFQIKEIKISGTEKVAVEEIRNLIEKEIEQKILFFPTKSIFLVNSNKIKEGIFSKFPQISEINLKREYPNILIAEIEERKPAAIFNQNGEYFFIDKEGIIFEETPQFLENYLKIKNFLLKEKIKLGDKAIEKKTISQILDIEKKLKEIDIKVKEFIIVSEERLNAKTSEGWEIYFNPKEDLNWQITELSLVLEKQIPPKKRKNLEYIDLRFSKIFYKYKEY